MATTTPNLGLTKPAAMESGWAAMLNANFDVLDTIPTDVCLPLAGGTLDEGANIVVGSTTGTKLATGVSQKLAFWGKTPVTQPSGANQAAMAAMAFTSLTDNTGGTASGLLGATTNTTSLTDNTGGTASATLAAISDTATKDAVASLAAQLATQRALNIVLVSAVASLAAKLNTLGTDVGGARTLLNQLRSDLVTVGIVKGSA